MRLESGKGKKRRPCFQNPDGQHQWLLHELVLYITIFFFFKKKQYKYRQTVKVQLSTNKRNALQTSSLDKERHRDRQTDRRQRVKEK